LWCCALCVHVVVFVPQLLSGTEVLPDDVKDAHRQLSVQHLCVVNLEDLLANVILRVQLYKTVLIPYFGSREHANAKLHRHMRAQAGLDRVMRAAFPDEDEVVFLGKGFTGRKAAKGQRAGNVKVCAALLLWSVPVLALQ
jgi:hypothetical protein